MPGDPTREKLRARLRAKGVHAFGSALYYGISSTIIISGMWWWPEQLALAMLAYVIAARIESGRPRLLVLRRFGDNHTEAFLSHALMGLSSFARALWLFDEQARPTIRKHLPSLWLYTVRTLIWVVNAWVIIGRVSGKLIVELLWVGWMIVGSATYHRYKAGGSPISWCACVAALIVVYVLAPPLPQVGATWQEGMQIAFWFFALWGAGGLVLAKTRARRLISRLCLTRTIQTEAQLSRFVHELSSFSLFPRYLPVAPIQVAEITCSTNCWPAAIYESIGASSIAVADVTNIDAQAALIWEIAQCRIAALPVLLTCESRSALHSRSVLREAFGHDFQLFVWHLDASVPSQVNFDVDALTACFFQLVESHLTEDLSYTPLRPSLEQAVADLESIRRGTLARRL